MSRTISSTITDAERDQVADWSHYAKVRKEFWSFSLFANNTGLSLDFAIPTSWASRSTGNAAYNASFHTDGTARVRFVGTTTAGDYNMSNTHALVTGRCLRPGLVLLASGQNWLYTATHTGSGVQLRRVQLTGTSNNLSFSLSNFGPLFGPASQEDSTRVRRVEAVCPTENGVIACVGTHDFALALTTLQFWWVDNAGNAYQLNTLIQMPLTTTFSDWGSVWYGGAKYCASVSATYVASRQAIVVVCNDQVRGRAVTFSVQSGVESQLRPVVEIDPDAELLSLTPHSLTQINGLVYLTARFVRSTRVGSTTTQTMAADVALISTDGQYWSFGERTWYLNDTAMAGALVIAGAADSPTTIYYAGDSKALSSPVTEIQNPGSNTSYVVTDSIESWTVNRVSRGSDDISLSLYDDMAAGGVSVHDANTHLVEGAALQLRTGMRGVIEDLGWFTVDRLAGGVTPTGRTSLAVSGVDLGSGKMIDHKAVIDTDMRGRVRFKTKLQKPEDIEIQTPVYGPDNRQRVRTTDVGLVYEDVNQPFIAWAGEASDSGDVFMEATVKFTGTNAYALSSFGFIFGATEDGEGNVFLVPKTNGWTGHTKTAAAMRGLKLNAVQSDNPDADETGFNFGERTNALWEHLLTTAIRTEAIGVSITTNGAFSGVAANVEYDLVLRVSGRRAQLFGKTRNYTVAQAANNAGYTLLAETIFGEGRKRSQPGHDLVGITMSTDVASSVDWFRQGTQGGQNTGLTDALNYENPNRFLASGVRSVVDGHINISPGCVRPGMYIYVTSPQLFGFHRRRVTTIDTYIHIDTPLPLGNDGSNNYSLSIFSVDVGDEWGEAYSGSKRETETGGKPIKIDPRAKKTPVQLGGRGVFISEDNSAASVRLIYSDGVTAKLMSGSALDGGTWVGWDATNPLPSGVYGASGSNPSAWRCVIEGGLIFKGDPATYGLPDGVATAMHFMVGDERFRAMKMSVVKRGILPCDTQQYNIATICPAYYAPTADTAAGLQSIRNWRSGANQPGDDLGLIPLVQGMQLKILSRDTPTDDTGEEIRYYVNGQEYITSPTDSSTSFVTIDKPYPNTISGIVIDSGIVKRQGDLCAITGRGMFGDAEHRMSADDVVCFWPGDNITGDINKIVVSHLARYTGNYLSVEDAVRRLCALSGMRAAEFRNYHTDPKTDTSITLTTSDSAIPLKANAANFVLDGRVHIPGSNTNSGGLTSERRLNIAFRNYYRLTIQQAASATDIAAGRAGMIRVGLSTISTDISAPSSGDYRWLALSAPFQLSDYSIAGAVSGSAPNYTITEDVARLVDLRVAVSDNLVTVEINGQHVWTFDLDRYTDGTTSYRRDTTGQILISYSGTVPSYTSTWRVLELGDEITTRYTNQEGSSAAQAVSSILDGLHVWWVATPGGGTRFSRGWTRDTVGAVTDLILEETKRRENTAQAGHYKVSGDGVAGETLNLAHIRARGYQYVASNGTKSATPEGAALDAQLLSREAAEYSKPRSFSGGGLMEMDPEDQFTYSYSAPGDRPQQTAITLVLSSAQLSTGASLRQVLGNYEAREL
jgi:hypothetical protein